MKLKKKPIKKSIQKPVVVRQNVNYKINYFRRLLDSRDTASIKRLTILIGLFLFTLNNLFSLFMRTTLANNQLVSENNQYCFAIIAVGILGVGFEYLKDALIEKAKASAAAQILSPTSDVSNVDNVEGDINTGKSKNVSKSAKTSDSLKKMKEKITNSLTNDNEIE